jgi:hypothetical protein
MGAAWERHAMCESALRVKEVFSSPKRPKGSAAHTASCSAGIRVLSRDIKRPERKVDHYPRLVSRLIGITLLLYVYEVVTRIETNLYLFTSTR